MAQRKIIFIGGCRMEIVFRDSRPAEVLPGGNMLNAAIRLGKAGIPTGYIGEAATDRTGDFIVGRLAEAGVDTECIDRYPDGATSIELIHDGPDDNECTIYTKPPRESLVIKWPKVGPNDIIVFGNWFALDRRTRPAVMEFVDYAVQRKALMVYMPGFPTQLEPAITHVMPQILDNLELADIIVTFNDDPRHLFGAADAAVCYQRNTSFYAPALLHISAGRDVSSSARLFDNGNSASLDIPETGSRFTAAADILADFLGYLARIDTDDAKSLTAHLRSWKPTLSSNR